MGLRNILFGGDKTAIVLLDPPNPNEKEEKPDADGYYIKPSCITNEPVFKYRCKYRTVGEVRGRCPRIADQIISEPNILDQFGCKEEREAMDIQHNRMLEIKNDIYNRIQLLKAQVERPYDKTIQDEIPNDPFTHEAKSMTIEEKKEEIKRLSKLLSLSPLRDSQYRRTARKLLYKCRPVYNQRYDALATELAKETATFNKAVARFNERRRDLHDSINALKRAYGNATTGKFGMVTYGGLSEPFLSSNFCDGVDMEYLTFKQAFEQYEEEDAKANK